MFLFVNVGMPSTAFGVYQTYIVVLPGMDHVLGSMVVSIRALVSLCATFLVARWFKRLDCRNGVVAGTVLTALGFLVYAFAGSFPVFAMGSVLVGLGYGLGGAVGSTLLIGRWFSHDIGKAAGIAAMGSGVCGAIIPVAVARVVEFAGLPVSFGMEAVIAVIVAVVVGVLLRNRPEDMGIQVQRPAAATEKAAAVGGRQGQIAASAHLLLVLAMVCVGAAGQGGVAYISILMTSNGIDEMFAATLLSIVGISLSVGKFASGAVMDAVGNRLGSLIFLVVFVVSLGLLCLSYLANPAICVVATIAYGLGASLGTTGQSVWALEFSTPATRAKVARDFQLAYAAGGFVFNLAPGILMQLTGTYITSYAIMGVMMAVAAVLIMVAYAHKARATA